MWRKRDPLYLSLSNTHTHTISLSPLAHHWGLHYTLGLAGTNLISFFELKKKKLKNIISI